MSDTPKQPTPEEIRDALAYGKASGDYTRFNMLAGQNAVARKAIVAEQAARTEAQNRAYTSKLEEKIRERQNAIADPRPESAVRSPVPPRRGTGGIGGMFARWGQ